MHSLQDEDKLEVHTALANRELSFGDATKKVEELKSWKRTRDTFLKEVKVPTWEEAQQRFPRYANKGALIKFNLKSEKDLPQGSRFLIITVNIQFYTNMCYFTIAV